MSVHYGNRACHCVMTCIDVFLTDTCKSFVTETGDLNISIEKKYLSICWALYYFKDIGVKDSELWILSMYISLSPPHTYLENILS